MTGFILVFGIVLLVGVLGFIATIALLGHISIDADRIASIGSISLIAIGAIGITMGAFVIPGAPLGVAG